MTPLEAAACAYVAAYRRSVPGDINQAWTELASKADAAEKRRPSAASKLPDAHGVAEKALPSAAELEGVDPRAGLAAARAAFARPAPGVSVQGSEE